MMLSDFHPGDMLAVRWPTNEYDELSDTEQVVQLTSVLGGRKKKGEKPHSAMVNIVDRMSMMVNTREMRCIPATTEVIEIVQRYAGASGDEAAADGDDVLDPMRGRRAR